MLPPVHLLADLADLVLPRACVGCGRAGPPLCDACGRADPVTVDGAGLRVVAAARYEQGVRAALLAYKERGRRDLAGPLGALLARAVAALGRPDAVLVPVPSAAAARRARGGDHVLRLARASGPGRRRIVTPLRLARAVRDSAGLDVAQRAANLDGAMRARPPRRCGAPAVVVDDITTSGTTITEAARALRAAGWTVVGAAVVAATPLRRPVRGDPVVRTGTRTATPAGTSPGSGLT